MIIPTIQDMLEARERIAPYVHKTPVLTSRFINDLVGAELFFKCENLQKAGAFKARGASNAGRPRKLSATPDLSGTVLPLCPIPNSALKNAPPFKSAVPKGSA
ncbi:hypothetical protein OO258_27220, partial [Pseudomonas sp. DCB_BI]